MRFVLGLTVCLLAAVLAAGAIAADSRITSPERGSPLRAELLDAARPIFEEETGGPIEFVVHRLNVIDKWAYAAVKLQRPGGVPIDWSRTKFAADYAHDMFQTEHHMVLLRNLGNGWAVIEYAIGPTDVAWDDWRVQHGLPRDLFEK